MKIFRKIEGKEMEFTLTDEELSKANAEFVTSWMTETIMNDFEVESKELAMQLGECAYARYCEGDGETEYECIEAVMSERDDELV